MDEFLEKYNLPTQNEEEADSLKRPITAGEIKEVIQILLAQKSPGPDSFRGEFYKTFKEELSSVLLRTAFSVSHKFWFVISSFSFVSRNILISSLISFLTHSWVWVFLSFFPWGWFLVSVPCGRRKCLVWFQFSWICWFLFCVLSCGLSLKVFHVHLKRMFGSLGRKALCVSVKSV